MREALLILAIAASAAAQTDPAQSTPAQQAAPSPAPAAAESPVPKPAEWVTGNIEFGYRWNTEVAGSYAEYRSVVNLSSGPRLFGLDAIITNPRKRFFDRATVRANSWGDPYGTTNINVSKAGLYDLVFDYRSMIYFNAVPSYANAFAPAGFNEQTFDFRQRTGTIDLTLFPTRRIVPYFGYWRNSDDGHGIQTWVQDANNSYAVPILFGDHTNNYHGGVRFEYNRFHVTLEQGGSTFGNEDRSDFTGSNVGDRLTPILGQRLVLNNLQQIYATSTDSIYSRILATANPKPWLDLYGQFLFSQPRTTVGFNETATGNFLLLQSLLFYSGQTTVARGTAVQPHTAANLGFEVRPLRRLRIIESWMTDRLHIAASPLIIQQLLPSATATPQTLITSLNYTEVVNYNRQQFDVLYDVTRKLTLRGGYRYLWGDATVLAGQLSQSGLLAHGNLQRHVAIAGLNYRWSDKLTVNAEYEGSSSDHIYFTTSLNDYNLGRVRARYQFRPSLSVQANFRVLNNQNPDPTIRYDFQSRDNAISVNWSPSLVKWASLTGEYDRFTLRSDIRYLMPQSLSPAISSYRDNAHTATALLDLSPHAVFGVTPRVTLGGSLFISSGSRPSNYYQPFARLSVPVVKHVMWNAEWRWYALTEQFYLYEGFRTHMFVTSLKLSR
jgi:hypothetical protein